MPTEVPQETIRELTERLLHEEGYACEDVLIALKKELAYRKSPRERADR